MATISDNLLSLANSKQRIKDDLMLSGKDSSSITNLDALIDLVFRDDLDSADTPFVPNPAWPQDLSTWTPDGGIGFIMSNDSAGKVSFVVTTDSANFTVVVNDGTTDLSTTSYASGATATVSVTPGDGTTYYAVKITSASPIRSFKVAHTTGVVITIENCPMLYFYGHLTTLTSCANMFGTYNSVSCPLLLAVLIDSTSHVTDMAYMFNYCYSLRAVPATLDTHLVTNMSYMFSNCYSLRATPELDVTLVTDMTAFGTNMRSVSRTLRDLTAATGLTKLLITMATGLKGITVSNIAPFSGTSPQIDITGCGLDEAALVTLFNSLPTVTGKTITISTCVGASALTAGERQIATNKGWTIVG